MKVLKVMELLVEFDNGSMVKYISFDKAFTKAVDSECLEGLTFLLEKKFIVINFNDVNINRIFVKAIAQANRETKRTNTKCFSILDLLLNMNILNVNFDTKITDISMSKVLEEAMIRKNFEMAMDLFDAGARPRPAYFSVDDAIQAVVREEVVKGEVVRGKYIGDKTSSDMMNFILAKWPGMDIPMDIPDVD